MKNRNAASSTPEEAARASLLDAERAWEVELRSVFGTRAFQARLLSGRSGEPGSALRVAYLAYMKAVRRWDEVAPSGLMVPSIYRPEKIKPREVKSRKQTPSPQPKPEASE